MYGLNAFITLSIHLFQPHANTSSEYYVAWFEPEHLIVPLKFFIKRFHTMRWSILTVDGCAYWDLQTLSYPQGVSRGSQIDDELETLWLEYYRNIFNTARLKLKAMQSTYVKRKQEKLSVRRAYDESQDSK